MALESLLTNIPLSRTVKSNSLELTPSNTPQLSPATTPANKKNRLPIGTFLPAASQLGPGSTAGVQLNTRALALTGVYHGRLGHCRLVLERRLCQVAQVMSGSAFSHMRSLM